MQTDLPDGECMTEAKTIGMQAAQYFRDLFYLGEYYMDDNLFAAIQPTISLSDNGEFCSILSIEEVWQEIQQLNPDSAPGNDGFMGHFYQAYWVTIKTDIHEVVVDFIRGGYLPRDITDTVRAGDLHAI